MTVWREYYRLEGDVAADIERAVMASREASKEQAKLAAAVGAQSFYLSRVTGKISALAFKDGIPKGFKKARGNFAIEAGLFAAVPNENSKIGLAAKQVLDGSPAAATNDSLTKIAGIGGIYQIDGSAMHFPTVSYVQLPVVSIVASVPRDSEDKWTAPEGFTEITASEYHRLFDAHNEALDIKGLAA